MEFWLRWNPLPMPRHLLWEVRKVRSSSKHLSRFLEFMQLPQTRDFRDSSENLKHQEQEVAEN